MSTAEILSMVSNIAYAAAAVSLVLALFFWFKFKIPSVISDLSGRTARKSIEKIRAHNEKNGGKKSAAAPKAAARKSAPVAEKPKAPSAPVQSKPQQVSDERPETGLLSDNKAMQPLAEETALLGENESTCLLDEDATALLDGSAPAPVRRAKGKKMTMLDDVILIHTDEVID